MPLRHTWLARIVAALALMWNSGAFAEEAQEGSPASLPGCESQEYRQFDFWIGTWTVTEGGQPAGQNTIEADLRRCALFESWRSADGRRGRSISFYDRDRGGWHQTWIDDRGGALELDGSLAGGSMLLEGERPDVKTGNTIRHRITWTPAGDGSVRQHWQTKKTGQSTWQTVFDGLYRRTR